MKNEAGTDILNSKESPKLETKELLDPIKLLATVRTVACLPSLEIINA